VLTRRKVTRLGIVAACALLVGCPRKTAIWIVGQEEPGRPVFGVAEEVRGRPTYLTLFLVSPCASWDGTVRSAIWFIDGGLPDPVRRIVYGRPPAAWKASYSGTKPVLQDAAPPLQAGCYVASTDGTGRVEFRVSADGSVLEAADEVQ
jgi:hypothetical protein